MTGQDFGTHQGRTPSAIEKLSGLLNTLMEKLLLIIGAAICLILFAQVLCRYGGASLGWSEEVSRHLLVSITFFGSTAAYKRSGFIGLKGIGRMLNPACERLLLLFMQLLTFCCFTVICWFGVVYVGNAWRHTTAALQLPMALPVAAIPLAALILAVHVLADINKTIRQKRGES